jgi:putative transcriptional regulator
MSNAYDLIMEGLTEAIAIERGELKGRRTTCQIEPVKTYSASKIRAIRKNAGMTQAVLASYMGVNRKTVEAWERGTNQPTGSARRLLSIIEDNQVDVLPFVKIT